MPSKTPQKRTARMTPVKAESKRRAAIEKRPRAATLITGGTGFLGSHLVRQLVENGTKDIRVMATSIPDWLVDLGVETFEGSITRDDDVVPDESYPAPLDLIARWPYYASKAYQEMAALERFNGKGLRLVIMNPSLLLGPGDDRLSSSKLILDFMARKISAVPTGGLSFVDARDAAKAFRVAMKKGRHGERYLMGAANWTFSKFFGRLERLTKVAAPRIALPAKFAVAGSRFVDSLFKQWNFASPVEPGAVEMAQYFWYLNCGKAARELGFRPRDPGETLHETVAYLRENFLGNDA